MSVLACVGRWLSIFISVLLYMFAWCWAIGHQKDCNRNAMWEVTVARLFIGLNIIAMGIWFIWSWNN